MQLTGAQLGDIIGDYTVLGELGQGGMATVLKVEKVGSGEIRALKLMSPSSRDEEAHARFVSEFKVLSNLEHPNITRVFERGAHQSRAFFVMEFVDGMTLRDTMKHWQDKSPSERFAESERIITQVVQALAYIHDRGIVHRDVSPGNIMLSDSGEVKLMDFGVVKTPGADVTTVGEMVGTVAYMAPEQIRGDSVDARADLYSLGTVLYQMLAGRRPFNSRTLAGYLEKHLNLNPRPPQEINPNIPKHLNDICTRLLMKHPSERYGSANHLLSILDRRLTGLKHVDLASWPPRLVGRQAERATIREAITKLDMGDGGAILIEGPTGFGKSRLMEEAVKRAEEHGIQVSRSNCNTSGIQFSGFESIAHSLVGKNEPMSPALGAVFRHEDNGVIEQYAIHSEFRDLLQNGGARVVIIDNIHRTDRGTIDLLIYLLRNTLSLAPHPILYLIGRQAPSGVDRFAEWIDKPTNHLKYLSLKPISTTSVEELLAQIIPESNEAKRLATRLHREGEGNPYFIAEMIRGLVEEGIIALQEDNSYRLTLSPEEVTRTKLPLPSNIREALRERVEPLSEDARRIASMLALCRQETSIEMLLEALGETEEDLLDILEELLDAGVVRQRVVGAEELYELAKPRLKDILTDDIPARDRTRMHRKIGGAMEYLFRHRLSIVYASLGYHFELGNVPAKAYPYLIRAAEKLCDRSFMPEALELIESAQELEKEAREYMVLDEADRRLTELLLLRGRVLDHMGEYDKCNSCFEKADAIARVVADPSLQSRTAEALGNYYRRFGRLQEASTHLSEALLLADQVGDPKLRVAPLYGLGSQYWAMGNLEEARHHYLNSLTVAGSIDDDRHLGLGYAGLGLVAICKGKSTEARKYLEQSAQICEKVGMLGNLSTVRVNLVELSHFTGNLRKGLQLSEKTIQNAREVQHPLGIALGLRYRAMILTDIGRFHDALENAKEAAAIANKVHDNEEEIGAKVAVARIHLAKEEWQECVDSLADIDQLLRDGDLEGYAGVVEGWRARAYAKLGDMNAAKQHLSNSETISGRSWPHQMIRTLMVSAKALSAYGNLSKAVDAAENALRMADESGYRLYSLNAHELLGRLSSKEASREMHFRVARNLTKSLSANLSKEDAKSFIAMHRRQQGDE